MEEDQKPERAATREDARIAIEQLGADMLANLSDQPELDRMFGCEKSDDVMREN